MTIQELYEKVNLRCPLDQYRFFQFYNESVIEILAQYGDLPRFVTKAGMRFSEINSLGAENVLLPLYDLAVLDNILYLCGQGDTYKSEFVRKAQEAYLTYWKKGSRGKHIQNGGW